MNPLSILWRIRQDTRNLRYSFVFLLFAVASANGASPLDTWHLRPVPFVPADLHRIAFGRGTFVALGDYGAFLTSSNGIAWSKHVSPIEPEFMQDGAYWLTYLNGMFFCLFSDFDDGWRMITSTNGIAWTTRPGTTFPYRFDYGNGVFVGTRGNALQFSTNGINWITTIADENFELQSVTFGNGLFVVVGQEYLLGIGYFGVILTSPDGWAWTYERVEPDEEFGTVVYGNGRFVAEGYFGNGDGYETNIMSSLDGSIWTAYGRPDDLEYQGALTFAGGLFLSAAQVNPDNTLAVLSSADGMTWQVHDLGTNFNSDGISGLAYGANTFVGVGDASLLIQSDLITNGPPAAAAILGIKSYPGLTITGSFGRTYTIESTLDVSGTNGWQAVTNITLSGDPYLWIDTTSVDAARRFYRAVAH